MERHLRAFTWPTLTVLGVLALLAPSRASGQTAAPAGPQSPPTRITLDEATDLALKHNHSLQAARTTILQNQTAEITANLRTSPRFEGVR